VSRDDLIQSTERGLYCPAGGFYIDPWEPVDSCIITHAHGDHARPGSSRYLTAQRGLALLRTRLGPEFVIDSIQYGRAVKIGDVTVSLHPSGHILGAAQVRIEYKGEVWVVSGDYKVEPDKTCDEFELIPCHTFVTESTFGLPIFRWRPSSEIFDEINRWWFANKEQGKCSIIFGYSLGKAQRILAGVDHTIGPIYSHGSVQRLTEQYREAGVALPATQHVGALPKGTKFDSALIIAPPSVQNSVWTRQFGAASTAYASGWMRIRGTRRRKSVDKGFTLSDHADWQALNSVIKGTGAQRVLVTHGYTAEMVNWLTACGISATALSTHFEGELGELQPSEEVSD